MKILKYIYDTLFGINKARKLIGKTTYNSLMLAVDEIIILKEQDSNAEFEIKVVKKVK